MPPTYRNLPLDGTQVSYAASRRQDAKYHMCGSPRLPKGMRVPLRRNLPNAARRSTITPPTRFDRSRGRPRAPTPIAARATVTFARTCWDERTNGQVVGSVLAPKHTRPQKGRSCCRADHRHKHTRTVSLTRIPANHRRQAGLSGSKLSPIKGYPTTAKASGGRTRTSRMSARATCNGAKQVDQGVD